MLKKMTLKEIQNFSLSILKDVHLFCKKNKINYSLAYGTLIGAIRHKGFIPWDDDIDIIMPRDDFERFCKIYKSETFHLVAPQNKDCWIGFARVCDLNLTYADTPYKWSECSTGLWIDIFPADGVCDDFDDFKQAIARGFTFWLKQQYCRCAKHSFTFSRSFLYNLKLLIIKIITLNGMNLLKYKKKLIDNAKKHKFGETAHWSQLVCLDVVKKQYQDIRDFDDVMEVPFENDFFYVMKGYDHFLHNVYGDYMQIPSAQNQIPGHIKDNITFYWKKN